MDPQSTHSWTNPQLASSECFFRPPGAPTFPPEFYVTPMDPQPALEFLFRDGLYQYRIHCKRLSYETIEHLLNNSLNGFNNVQNEYEHNFFYRHQNDQFYQISCRIVSPEFINHYMNTNMFGI